MVRIGIVGIGGLADGHAAGLGEVQRSGACELVAVAEPEAARYTARVEELRGQGVSVFPSADEMYDTMRGAMDAVTIPAPIHKRCELTIAAVQSGYHVLVAGPPAATIQDVDEMIAAVRRSGRICAVAFSPLWSQSMALLTRRIGEGALGQVQQVACAAGFVCRTEYYDRAAWLGRLRLGETWVLDGTANTVLAGQLAAMLALATPDRRALAVPAAVRAELYAAHQIESEDTAAVEIVTNEGPRCYFLASLCADEQFAPELTVLASQAVAYRSGEGRVCIRYNDGRLEAPTVDDARQEVAMIENFVAAAAANDVGLLGCHLEMCRPFALAVNGAFESARQIQRISPPHVRADGEGGALKTIVEGIDAAIPEAASQCRLFSDLQLPWARRTATFDLTGYDRFPQQFAPARSEQEPASGELPFG